MSKIQTTTETIESKGGTLPQNKNLTHISLPEGGFGKHNGVSMQARRELIREAATRYQKAGKKEKTGILNELITMTV